MKPPRFTDGYRYPDAYVPSRSTNIAETFRRVREREAARLAREERSSIQKLPRRSTR